MTTKSVTQTSYYVAAVMLQNPATNGECLQVLQFTLFITKITGATWNH